MSLGGRFTVWWEARKASRKAIAARQQHDRAAAEASLARALTHEARDGGALRTQHMVIGDMFHHGSIGTDCSPGVSGNCSGPMV
jgi:hypothetical protein